jgi:phage terminase Nu1 subunit (DNA packaging protein)
MNAVMSQQTKFMNESGIDIDEYDQDEFVQYLAEKAEDLENKLSQKDLKEKCDHCLSHKIPDLRFVKRMRQVISSTTATEILVLQQKEECDLCGEEFWKDVPIKEEK